jgi:hypothetical protein
VVAGQRHRLRQRRRQQRIRPFNETADANGIITIALTNGTESVPQINAINVVPAA